MNPDDKLDYETPRPSSPEDFVTLATFQTDSEAQPLRIALEENGIPVFIADDNAVTVNWLWGPALGYVKVQVPKAQAEAALEIARQHVPATKAEKELERPDVCLSCGAAMPEDGDRCPKCGWTFNTAEEDDESEASEDEPES
jgi:ribosomal protein L40E